MYFSFLKKLNKSKITSFGFSVLPLQYDSHNNNDVSNADLKIDLKNLFKKKLGQGLPDFCECVLLTVQTKLLIY